MLSCSNRNCGLLDLLQSIVAKASDGQLYPLISYGLILCDKERGSGSEEANDVCF